MIVAKTRLDDWRANMQGAFRELESRWRPEIARHHIPRLGRPAAELLATLAAAAGTRRALELGTAIGYSAAYLAVGMGPKGQVTCVDHSPDRAALAQRLWAAAGLGNRITLQQGDVLALLPGLGTDYDLVFVDLLWELGREVLGRRLAAGVMATISVPVTRASCRGQ
jgi:predicted O-methyltransferase YrrM